jgi:hypothetical protein
MLANTEVPPSASPSERIAIQGAIAEAFVTAFRFAALTAAGLALVSSAIAALTIEALAPKLGLGGHAA